MRTGKLPAALAEASRSDPVVLYASAKCQPCDERRKLLAAGGISFAEETVTSHADVARLGDGKVELPQQLQVGT